MTADAQPNNVVDAHTHIFPPDVARHREPYLQRDAWFAALYGRPTAKIATAEDLIASMDRSGVSSSVVVTFGWRDEGIGAFHNAYLLDAARRYPGRLLPFAHVGPGVDEPDLAGFAGIGEWMPEGQDFTLDESNRLAGQLRAAHERNLPVLTHVSEPVGHGYPGKSNVAPEQLWRLARAYPNNRFIAAHWGGGLLFYELMPEMRADLRNVWYDTAAGRLLYSPAIYSAAAQIVGPEKLLWGSDFPLVSQGRDLRAIRRTVIDEQALQLIVGDNCRSVLQGQ